MARLSLSDRDHGREGNYRAFLLSDDRPRHVGRRAGRQAPTEELVFSDVHVMEHLRSYRWVVVESFRREFEEFENAVSGKRSSVATGAGRPCNCPGGGFGRAAPAAAAAVAPAGGKEPRVLIRRRCHSRERRPLATASTPWGGKARQRKSLFRGTELMAIARPLQSDYPARPVFAGRPREADVCAASRIGDRQRSRRDCRNYRGSLHTRAGLVPADSRGAPPGVPGHRRSCRETDAG